MVEIDIIVIRFIQIASAVRAHESLHTLPLKFPNNKRRNIKANFRLEDFCLFH